MSNNSIPDLLQNLAEIKPSKKTTVVVIIDLVSILLSLSLAHTIITGQILVLINIKFIPIVLTTCALTTLYLLFVGFYKTVLRHVSTEASKHIVTGSIFSSLVAAIQLLYMNVPQTFQLAFLHGAFLCLYLTGTRVLIRLIVNTNRDHDREKLVIYGAGSAGAQTVRALKSHPSYEVSFLIDDDVNLHDRTIYGVPIKDFSYFSDQIKSQAIDTVVLAIPSVSLSQRQRIIKKLSDFPVRVQTIPSITSLIDGTTPFSEFKKITVEDLLGREVVKPDKTLMAKNIRDRNILVTGAGGSIGSSLCKQIIEQKPTSLLLLDVSEFAIYKILNEIKLEAEQADIELHCLVGSIQDRSLISKIFQTFSINTIYHAAAYKHVPLMEENIFEAVKNNSFGTLVLAEEAIKAKVRSFTLISTDKAVNPANIMGATKRLAELICQSANLKQDCTCFSMVRFGNVLGSSGSVVPLFEKQIKFGGPVTVTHQDMERYFMTIDEAVQLVIQASSMATGGEVFVLDMGDSIKIIELAEKMVRLAGSKPKFTEEETHGKNDILIKVTGLRPGEKLFEELSYQTTLKQTSHQRIMQDTSPTMPVEQFDNMISEITQSLEKLDLNKLKKFLEIYTNLKPMCFEAEK